MASVFKRLFRDRRSATAVALAIMTVPLLITAGAAVDFARVASARALLQASTDAAAIAGAGAWQTSKSSSYAASVTTAAYDGTAAQLANFVTASAPTPELTCTGSSTQCGGTASYATTTSTYGCPSAAEYCVVLTASGVLKNSLLGPWIPSETLTVKSIATTAFPPETISGKNIPPSPGFGSAGDVSGIYAYAVPMSGTGSSATPEYTQMPQPNSSCTNYASLGPLAVANHGTAASTSCNYLFIALSTSAGTGGSGGSITLQQNQPIAFSFVNYTGANGYHSTNYFTASTDLMVYENGSSTGTYYQNGLSIATSTTTTYTCSASGLDSNGNCPNPYPPNSTITTTSSSRGSKTVYTTSVTTQNMTALTGSCPDHTLYGSLDSISVNTTTGANNDGIPTADSLNIYSSAYEVLGYPPTYETNHALIPFLSPISVGPITDLSGNSYKVKAICPNYIRSSTSISAPVSSSYASLTGWNGVNIFSTAFPGQIYTDSTLAPSTNGSGTPITSGANDIFPPSIAGCTPATSAEDGGVTPASDDPWWNWNRQGNAAGGNNYCTNESSADQSSYLATGQPTYGNCALLIQPLGTAVPVNSSNQALLPDYYLLVETSSGAIVGMDPIWDGQTFTDLMPGIITDKLNGYDSKIVLSGTTVTDSDTAATYSSGGTVNSYGYTPSSTSRYTVSSGTYRGDTVIIEQPAYSSHYDFNPPAETSYQCYNPQANGNTSSQVTIQGGGGSTTPFASVGGQNNGTAVDPVANPQLGAILCTSNPPETYALYWNDLGSYEADDLGYWNAVVAFTCSVPGTNITGGGPATLSG